jgi:hypothetical protein
MQPHPRFSPDHLQDELSNRIWDRRPAAGRRPPEGPLPLTSSRCHRRSVCGLRGTTTTKHDEGPADRGHEQRDCRLADLALEDHQVVAKDHELDLGVHLRWKAQLSSGRHGAATHRRKRRTRTPGGTSTRAPNASRRHRRRSRYQAAPRGRLLRIRPTGANHGANRSRISPGLTPVPTRRHGNRAANANMNSTAPSPSVNRRPPRTHPVRRVEGNGSIPSQALGRRGHPVPSRQAL